MKFDQLFSEDEFLRIRELAPAMAPAPAGAAITPGMAPAPGQAAVGVDPQAAAKAQAMAVKQMQDQKKALQDQIKSKEMELQDLRKKLAELG
jgi:hypothetical protein